MQIVYFILARALNRFEPYYAVRRQMFFILRAMNRERRSRGFKPVPEYVLGTRLRKVKPFEQPAGTDAKAA